mmetsp:Transcript_7832/g.23297  ORF Transcript_7832/g.23297 Transcript_7832/m.23297 type:complete len:168 (+) Transcript_7832:182-685(+)
MARTPIDTARPTTPLEDSTNTAQSPPIFIPEPTVVEADAAPPESIADAEYRAARHSKPLFHLDGGAASTRVEAIKPASAAPAEIRPRENRIASKMRGEDSRNLRAGICTRRYRAYVFWRRVTKAGHRVLPFVENHVKPPLKSRSAVHVNWKDEAPAPGPDLDIFAMD